MTMSRSLGHVVHQLVADVEFARGDLLQARHHAQRGGFAAARRADQYDELIIRDLKVEIVDCRDLVLRGTTDSL